MQILKLISRIALLLLCINCTVSMAQTNKQKKAELDSLENLLTPSQKDSLMELLAILEQDNPKNTLDVSVNVANAQLSKTNLLTNKSVTYNGLLVTPNITFTLINGINLTYENSIASQGNNTVLLQHQLSLGYDYSTNNDYIFGFSLSKYFTKDSTLFDASLFDYECNGNFCYLKSFVQPFINISYAQGNFSERLKNPLTGIVRTFEASISGFNTTVGVQHYFELKSASKFKKKWAIDFTPKVQLYLASQKYKNNIPQPRKKAISQSAGQKTIIQRSITDKFQAQSIGLELGSSFYKGNFYMMPNLYFDYGVNVNAGEQKLFMVASITFGHTF